MSRYRTEGLYAHGGANPPSGAETQTVEARTKLLVTLSDGKPDDYDLEVPGRVRNRRHATGTFEKCARREYMHTASPSIVRTGLSAAYVRCSELTVLDDVAKLPTRISDIYRRITS